MFKSYVKFKVWRTDEKPEGQRQTYFPPPSDGDSNTCKQTILPTFPSFKAPTMQMYFLKLIHLLFFAT